MKLLLHSCSIRIQFRANLLEKLRFIRFLLAPFDENEMPSHKALWITLLLTHQAGMNAGVRNSERLHQGCRLQHFAYRGGGFSILMELVASFVDLKNSLDSKSAKPDNPSKSQQRRLAAPARQAP
jgi:hypothetical protein